MLRAVAAQILDEVREAAERGVSYRALGQGFCVRRFAGRDAGAPWTGPSLGL